MSTVWHAYDRVPINDLAIPRGFKLNCLVAFLFICIIPNYKLDLPDILSMRFESLCFVIHVLCSLSSIVEYVVMYMYFNSRMTKIKLRLAQNTHTHTSR